MTLSKNGKKIGRPLGSKSKAKIPSPRDQGVRLQQAKMIKSGEDRIAQLEYEKMLLTNANNKQEEMIQHLRAELSKAQLACLDGVAVIRYLEKKVYELVKANERPAV